MLMVLMRWSFFSKSRFSIIKSYEKNPLRSEFMAQLSSIINRGRRAQLRWELSKHSFQPSLTLQPSLCNTLRDDIKDKNNYKQTILEETVKPAVSFGGFLFSEKNHPYLKNNSLLIAQLERNFCNKTQPFAKARIVNQLFVNITEKKSRKFKFKLSLVEVHLF